MTIKSIRNLYFGKEQGIRTIETIVERDNVS